MIRFYSKTYSKTNLFFFLLQWMIPPKSQAISWTTGDSHHSLIISLHLTLSFLWFSTMPFLLRSQKNLSKMKITIYYTPAGIHLRDFFLSSNEIQSPYWAWEPHVTFPAPAFFVFSLVIFRLSYSAVNTLILEVLDMSKVCPKCKTFQVCYSIFLKYYSLRFSPRAGLYKLLLVLTVHPRNVTQMSAARNTSDSLHCWFWINFLHSQKLFNVAKIFHGFYI